MKILSFILLLSFGLSAPLLSQCEDIFDKIDEFDSTRVVMAQTVNIGYMIPSMFETENGAKMIEQAKLLFTYTEGDSINSFFMTLATAEYSYLSIENGDNVLIKLSDDEVIPLFTVSDRGEFDRTTNMRVYLHTCLIPLDLFYRLTHVYIEKIRINYKGKDSTIEILPKQQEAIRNAVRCVGKASNLFPIKP